MTREKVALVKEHAPRYGLNQALAALELPKSTWYYWEREKREAEEKYAAFRTPLFET